MQCKYLHRSNEHLSLTRSDENLKLPLENICNFVAKKQKERKNEMKEPDREIRVSFTHLRFAIRLPSFLGGSCRRPPSFALDKKLKHFAVSPYVFSHLAPPTHRLPSRQALVRQLTWAIECCSCTLFHGKLLLSILPYTPTLRTHTYTATDTLTCVFTSSHGHCLAAAAAAFAILTPQNPTPPTIISVMSFQLVVLASFAGCCLIVTPTRKAEIFRVRMPTLWVLHV